MKNQAFTLIELLVVVLIIGILAAIAVPQYQKAVMKSRYSNLKPIVKSLAQAEAAYFLANGRYTENINELDLSLPGAINDPENSRNYLFDWGLCYLSNNSDVKNNVCCINNNISMGYYIVQEPNTSRSNCIIFASTMDEASSINPQNQICQSETGLSIYTTKNDNHFISPYVRYKYP